MRYSFTIEASEEIEKASLKRAMNADSVMCAVEEFANYLRGRLKYSELSEEVATELGLARDAFFESFSSRGLSVYDE